MLQLDKAFIMNNKGLTIFHRCLVSDVSPPSTPLSFYTPLLTHTFKLILTLPTQKQKRLERKGVRLLGGGGGEKVWGGKKESVINTDITKLFPLKQLQ